MTGRLEPQKWIDVHYPAYAVALSENGQYLVCGTEQGAAVYNITGQRLFAHPPSTVAMPIHQLAITADLSQLYLGARQGWLIRMDLTREDDGFRAQARQIYEATNDLHTLALSADGRTMAVGHLAPGLAAMLTDGRRLWRQHPDEATATDGQTWAVALDANGQTLYAGSSGPNTNYLLALDAQTGATHAARRLEARAPHLATLTDGKRVAVALVEDAYTFTLAIYDTNLNEQIWVKSFDESITALAADPQKALLAVAYGYEGQIEIVDANSGRTLASGFSARSRINGLALVRGQVLATASEDGHLALIHYLP